MKTYPENQSVNSYKSGRNVALAIYVICATTVVSAYTMVQLLQVL